MIVTKSKLLNQSISGWAMSVAFTFLSVFWLMPQVNAQQLTQPIVAIHDSEMTRGLTNLPVSGATPNTTGNQWWETDWNYFVMPDALKEAFTSDGTAFTVIGDSNISSGLLLPSGAPKYPIIFSLASEVIRNDEIAQLTNYVAAGGFLFISGTSFTRNTNGATLGDFAIANQMGVHMVTPSLQNWNNDSSFTRQFAHPLVSHIPDGQITWRLPAYSEEINWGISPNHIYTNSHDVWQIQASDATIVAMGDTYPYLTVKPYGKGYFIYEAAFNPIITHGGFGPGMYAYVILRKAVEWAFASNNLPIPKLSPWPYQYDAAFMLRHDLEDYANEMADIEASAGVEFTNGVRGDYYMCTGTVRQDMVGLGYDTNAVIQSIRRAITNYGATVSSHNGGLKNASNLGLNNLDYDYWHWGTDEALDFTPAGFANGTAYAKTSLSNSFNDVETWFSGLTKPSMRSWVACNFNATREASYILQSQLNLKIIGDQKISPFPHWTLSTQTPDKKYAMLTEPVSEWFINGALAQSLEPWHPPGVQDSASLHTSIDFYYNLGTLVNFYSHTLSTGEGDAGQLTPDYIMYSMNTNAHPRLWNTNGAGIYQWWLTRSNVQITASYSTNGLQSIVTYSIKGATDPNTAIELLTPGSLGVCSLTIKTNGTVAGTNAYRMVNNSLIRLKVGSSVTNAVVSYNLQVLGGQVYAENFDEVSTPSLPSGWSSSATGNDSAWVTKTAQPDSSPNSVFVSDPNKVGTTTLVSPQIVLPAGTSQLSFRNNYNLEPSIGGAGFDGGVLEIKIGANAFKDIILAGGSFVAGAYTGSAETTNGNPLGDRPVWSGNSGGYITTIVNLPPAASGQTVQFQWICGTDAGNATGGNFTGWRIDTIAITNLACQTCGNGTNPPVLFPQNAQTIGEGNTLTVTNTAGESNNPPNALIYTLVNPPTFAQIDQNGIITWTPAESQGPGSYTIQTLVTDCNGRAASNSFNVTVTEVNTAPIFPSPGTQTVNEQTQLLVTNTATDSDVPTNTLTYQLVSPPNHMTINANTGVISWTPDESQGPGSYVITTIVTDSNSLATNSQHLSTTNNFTVNVNEVNTAPFFNSNPTNQTINELTLLQVTNAASDSDIPANTLSYTLLNPPTGASVDTNGVITWIPSGTQGPNTYLITTVVTDSNPNAVNSQHLSATNNFNVTVNDTATCLFTTVFQENFDGVTAPALPAQWTTSFGIGESNWVTQTTVKDSGSNALFSPDVGTTGSNILTSPSITTPSGQLVFAFRNNYAFEVGTGTDGYDGGVLEMKIGNGAFTDILAAGGNFISGGYNSVIDPGFLNPLKNRQAWSGSSGGFITTAVTLPSAASSTNIQFRWITGTDSGNGSNGWRIDTVTLSNLICVANGPLLPQQSNVITAELTPLTFINTASEAGSPPPTFTYQLISPPQGANISTNGIITWTPQQTQSPGNYLITTLVTDNSQPTNLTASNSFTVTVKEVNVAPTPPNILAQTINELLTLTVNDAATETNIHSTTTGYGLINPLSGMNVTSAGLFTWTPQQSQSPTNVTVTIVVTNSNPFDTNNPILKATNSFGVKVNEVNVAPTPPFIGAQIINELLTLTVNDAATETNVHATTTGYGLINPLQGMAITSAGLFTWTPQPSQSPTNATVTIVVTNNDPFDTVNPILTATNSFSVMVKEVNIAPLPASVGPQTVNELVQLTVNDAATEPNPHATTTGYGFINPLPGMAITSAGLFTWTPQPSQSPTNVTVTIVVTNSDPFDTVNPILTATNSFSVMVKEVNIAPLPASVGPQTVNELVQLTVNDAATEPNVHATTTGYGLINPLSGMAITSAGLFTWTPQPSQSPTNVTVTIVVTNSDPFDTVNPTLTATNSFNVKVNEVNVAPLPASVGPQTVNELVTLTVNNAATEPNVHATTTGYGLINPLSGMAITSAGLFTWTPQPSQSPTNVTVTIVVTNSDPFDTVNPILTATNSFSVMVKEVNIAPLPASVGPQTVNELVQLTVNDAATEPNAHAATTGYGLINPLSGMAITSAGLFTWTPQPSQSPTNVTVTIVVTNSDPFDTNNPILTASNSFSVAVLEVNIAPVLPTNSLQTVVVLGTLTVTNTATEPNIHATTIGYGLINPPSTMGIDSNGIITWVPGTDMAGTTNLVTTVATNNDVFDLVNPQLTTTNMFQVVVNGIHNGPSLRTNLTDLTVNNLTTVTVTNTATDNDIPLTGLSYHLISAPYGAVIDGNGIITWAPTAQQSPSTNMITTVVSDSATSPLTATNSFTVFVGEPVTPPTILSIELTNSVATVTWSAAVGHTYRLQFKNLADTNWTEVPTDITVTNGTTGTATNSCGNAVLRFYRVADMPETATE